MKRNARRIFSFVLACIFVLSSALSNPICAFATEKSNEVTLAAWNYDNEDSIPSLGSEFKANATTGSGVLTLSGATYSGWGAKALTANSWTNEGYWLMDVDASSYENMTFSAKMRSSSTAPANFKLQYSLNNGLKWTDIGESVTLTTSLANKFNKVSLPTELNQKKFLLRIVVDGDKAINGNSIAANGNSNINAITIMGSEIEQTTENKDKDSQENDKTSEAIEATEKESNDEGSEKSEDKPSEETKEVVATHTSEVNDNDELVIYYDNGDKDGVVLGTKSQGTKLLGETAVPNDDKITVPKDAAVLTVSENEDGDYTFVNKDNKYLTSKPTGSGLSFEEKESEYSLWNIKQTETGFYIINKNAKYGTSNQYLEYYNGFTTYSYKSSNDGIYVYNFYKIKSGTPKVKCDSSVTLKIAQWAGNANYDEEKITEAGINGDLFATNDLLDKNSIYTAVVNGKESKPYTAAKSSTTGSTSYYMGATGVGSGSNDYMQFALSSKGYGNMNMAFRMRASNTAAGSFQLQYSTDGTNFENFKTGTYSYAYTAYSKDGTSSNVSKSGEITDGVASPSLAPTYYVSFKFDVPAQASNADKLYIRLVPGKNNAKGANTIASTGVIRIDSVVLTGNPVISPNICGFVKANPASGEIAKGSEISLESSTKETKIFYSINDGEVTEYNADKKPVIDEFPAKLTAYASKEGLADSIKVSYQYEQAKCATVKGTPNGGAVTKNTKVKLKTATEDASIMYAFESGDEKLDWKKYEEPISLKELPATLKVKAVKEGYVDSPISTLSFTEKTDGNYNIYFGQIHAHTNYSDGSGSVDEAFEYAKNVDNLDFLAITDHSNSLDNATESDITKNVDKSETDEWTKGHALAKQYSTDKFTCIYGYEMTWSNGLGHMNTFNTEGFQSRTQTEFATYSTALQNYYKAINKVPDSISQFNHPGTTFGDFNDFAHYSESNDALITMIEVGNGEGAIGSSGYFPSYEYYTRALDKGWHVAPTNNQDNHKGKWGDANTARTVVLADSNNEDSIYDAMRNYRIYATEDNNLNIYYTLDNNVMGSVLEQDQVGDKVSINVDIKDMDKTDSIGNVEVIVNGGLSIASKKVTGNEETVKFEVPSSYSYYYIKITEADKDIAVTAPIWVGEVEACGINKTYTNTVLPVQGEPLDVNVDFYNNENSDLEINDITVSLTDNEGNNKEISKVTGEEAKLKSVPSKGTATYSMEHTYNAAGAVTYEVTINAVLNGVSKTYSDKLSVSYVTKEMVTNVIIDGTHYNDYVSGYYGGNMGSFIKLCASKNIRASIEKEKITKEKLKDCSLLVVSAPAKKNGTANAGDYTVSHFNDEFIDLIKEYVANGGSIIVCGLADYSDTTNCQASTELNKLLKAIGSTMAVNSDEVYDEVNNGGQPYRLYPTNFNKESKFLNGVVEGQKYSQYSGCSIDITTDGKENEIVDKAEALVSGFDTTYSIDCKDAEGNSAGNKPNDNKGKVTFLGHQSTKSGGDIFAAGGVFMSDFEVSAEIDNNDSLPYANYNIISNILDKVQVTLKTSTIKEARAGKAGDVFAVEGYVTNGTANEYTTFFDTIYIQDETAGIDIFPYSQSGLEIGTKVRVVGYVAEYQGDLELKVISTEILDEPKKIIEPKEVNTKEAMDYANNGGSLLKTTGKVTKVEYTSEGDGVSEFWIKDDSGKEAAIFIDGYIYSGTTGKNQLATFVKKGATVSATGILYMHPEGESDKSVPVFRVRNCDEILLIKEASKDDENAIKDALDNISKAIDTAIDKISKTVNDSTKNVCEKASELVEAVQNVVDDIVIEVSKFWKKLFGRH